MGAGTASAALCFGIGSALFPVLNAEAYALITASRSGVAVTVLVALALAVGQTLGKLGLFEGSRRGSHRLLSRRVRREREALDRWLARIEKHLTQRRTGVPLVLASASLGLPPLAVVSLAAGAAGQDRTDFVTACLIGRAARFLVLALPLTLAI